MGNVTANAMGKYKPGLAFLDHLKRTKNQIISQRFSWYEKY